MRMCLFLEPVSSCVLWQSQKMMSGEVTGKDLSQKAMPLLAVLSAS